MKFVDLVLHSLITGEILNTCILVGETEQQSVVCVTSTTDAIHLCTLSQIKGVQSWFVELKLPLN